MINPGSEDTKAESIIESNARPRPTLTLDVALYEAHFAQSDMSDAEKSTLLQSLWDIIVGFVDLGFNVQPAQLMDAQTMAASARHMLDSAHPVPPTQSKTIARPSSASEK